MRGIIIAKEFNIKAIIQKVEELCAEAHSQGWVTKDEHYHKLSRFALWEFEDI